MPLPLPMLRPDPRPQPRADGAWRIGETWHPLTPLPNDFRWWRKPMPTGDFVEYQITDDQAAVLLTVVLADCRRVPINSNDVARARVIVKDLEPAGELASRLIATRHVVVDILTNLPPYQLIPWRPLTDPGDCDPPDPRDDDERGRVHRGPPPHTVNQHSTWFPPTHDALQRVRYGR